MRILTKQQKDYGILKSDKNSEKVETVFVFRKAKCLYLVA